MPVEYELKFILDRTKHNDIAKAISSKSQSITNITQSYINDGRIRKIERNDEVSFVFTFKADVKNELIEIETDISEEDYEKLFTISKSIVRKKRITVVDGSHNWDVDLIYNGGECYFVVAEVECNYGEKPSILKELEPYVVYSVPYEDNSSFTNKKIANRDYAEKVYSSLHKYSL